MNPTLAILLVASLVAASCALVGTFLVLRKMALLGDAISHAVLPGIAIAFLVFHSMASWAMILGAAVLGVVTVFLVEILHRSGRLYEDASIGVVFPALFAAGVILISKFMAGVHLDLECVLYGEIAWVNFDVVTIGGTPVGPKALWVTGFVFLLDLALVLVFYKELKLSSFDPLLGASLGFSPVLLHYLLMSAVSVTVVGSFESVGAILVVAMLVVPPAAAYLLTDRLWAVLALAVGIGVASALSGYAVARVLDASIAGGMACAAGGFFVLAFVVSPSHGILTRMRRHHELRQAMAAQLLLLHLDPGGGPVSLPTVRERLGWPRDRVESIARWLAGRGCLVREGEELRLTDAGRTVLRQPGRGI